MIEYVKRLAGPFTSEGQSRLPFGFLIFEKTDVYVATADDPEAQAKMLVYGQDYSVEMNADQTATPGGTVVLTTPIVKGNIFVVGSAVAYTQNMQLTNYSRFPPEIINEAMDRVVVQIQQLVERLDRALFVPPTSDSTPEQLIEKLMAAQNDARQFADQAKTSAEEAKKIAQQAVTDTDGIRDEINQSMVLITQKVNEATTQAQNSASSAAQSQANSDLSKRWATWTTGVETEDGTDYTVADDGYSSKWNAQLAQAWAVKTDGKVTENNLPDGAEIDYSSKYYAQQAKASADAADTSEASALSSKNAAATSASAAKTSETNAKKSENNAKASETAAASSKSDAAGSATAAAASADAAKVSQNAAAGSASSASTSEENAANSATSANASKTAAASSAEAAKASQTAAANSATAAQGSSTAAATSEQNAANSATAANASKTAAAGSATTASTKAAEASASAQKAKDWASKEDGPVEGEGTTAEYSAKYYAQQANQSNSVKYVAQTLSATQQTQARDNIGAASATDVGTLSSSLQTTNTNVENLGNTVNENKTATDAELAKKIPKSGDRGTLSGYETAATLTGSPTININSASTNVMNTSGAVTLTFTAAAATASDVKVIALTAIAATTLTIVGAVWANGGSAPTWGTAGKHLVLVANFLGGRVVLNVFDNDEG